MGFISLVDEIQLMLTSSRHICISSIFVSFLCCDSFAVMFVEHTCSIIASLFRNLVGNLRSRLVQKFVENDHIKVDRLMELHFKYYKRIQECDAKIEREREVNMEYVTHTQRHIFRCKQLR